MFASLVLFLEDCMNLDTFELVVRIMNPSLIQWW